MSESNGFKLTAVKVARLKKPGRYGDGHGLYLRIAEYPDRDGKLQHSKNWVFRFERDGAERWMGLGSLRDVTLAQARQLARDCKLLLVQGFDPIAARQAKRQGIRLAAARAVTFRQCAEKYIAAHRPSWRSAIHAEQWPTSLSTYVYPTIGDLSVSDIDTAMVLRCIEPIWHEVPTTAMRVRGRIEAVLDWAKARGYRDGENPARWKGHLINLLPARTKLQRGNHRPALPYAQAPAFMAELRARNEVAARALEFTILTAARSNEAIGATWGEIDLIKAKTWTVPGERMKTGRPHIVPLSDRTVEILKTLPRVRGCDYLFPGAKAKQSINRFGMLELLRSMRPDVTVHGFRSTFRDWCGDRTNYPRDIVEAALAHRIEDQVEAAYRRGTAIEKRRLLMADWARYLAKPTARKAGGDNVVAMR
jgi:integrase